MYVVAHTAVLFDKVVVTGYFKADDEELVDVVSRALEFDDHYEACQSAAMCNQTWTMEGGKFNAIEI